MEAPIKFWAFSAVKKFEQCPYQIYLERVERAPRPNYEDDPSHPLVRGDRIHKEAEAFIVGKGPFTKDLKRFRDLFAELKLAFDDGEVYVEQKWGFDREWASVEWKDRWAGVVCDLVRITEEGKLANVYDWKTGKSMNNEIKHQEQLQLYAIATFMKFPSVDVVQAEMIYLDEGKRLTRKFSRSVVPHYAARWAARGNKLTSAMVFPPKPNTRNCRFCDFGPNVGTGMCPYAPDPL